MTDRLKFELNAFEDLLEEAGATVNTEFNYAKEGRRVIKVFIQAQYEHEETRLEHYIQKHQSDTIRLLNRLHKQEGLVYEAAASALYEILNHIEQHHSKYFDENCVVPESYRLMSMEQLRQDGLVLQAKLKSKRIDPALQGELIAYLSKLAEAVSCTYKELIYAKTLMRCLLDLLSVNKDCNWNRKVVVELYYLNFNKSTFFTYCRRLIAREVDALGSFTEQLKHFDWFSREMNKLNRKPNVAYKSDRKALPKLLNSYIAREIASLLERAADKTVSATPQQTFTERAERFDFKLPLNLSVPQLALFVQLFIVVGVFIVEKGQIMTVMKFFAANVTTKGTDEISAENLNKQRTKPLAAVVDVVEGILLMMLEALKEM